MERAATIRSGDAGTRRRAVRYGAAVLSGGVAVCYLVLLVLVAHAETRAGAETTFGAYLYLAVLYSAGAVLLALRDQRVLWAIGAVVQLAVLVLFVLFGIGVFGPGLFDDATLAGLHMVVWASLVSGAELVLLGLLGYLALTPITPRYGPSSWRPDGSTTSSSGPGGPG